MLYLSDDIMETCFVPDAKHHLLQQIMFLSYDIIQIFLLGQYDKSLFGKGYVRNGNIPTQLALNSSNRN